MDIFGVRRLGSQLRTLQQPEIDPAVVKDSYSWHEVLPSGETQILEFKSGVDGSKGDPGHALQTVKSKIARYISAFLNSAGGVILFGVEDDGRVSGCAFTERQRMEAVKAVDSATQCVDPQVDTSAVRHTFAPVSGAPAQQELWVLIVIVVCAVRQQPVYYTSSTTCDAWIRRSESVYLMDWSLIRQREAEYKKVTGQNPKRSWRHVASRAIPFDDHIDSLRQQAPLQSRVWVFRQLCCVFSERESGPLVCVLGAPGCGKSTLMATMVNHGRSKRPEKTKDGTDNIGVVGWHFCMAGVEETLSAIDFVQNFAAALCSSPYTTAFKKHVLEHPVEVLRVTEISDPLVAFKNVLRLCGKLTHPGRRLAYVVDAVDESLVGQGEPDQPTILQLLWSSVKECPNWLVFIITTRTLSFPGIPKLADERNVVNLDVPESEEDVTAYISCRLNSDPNLAVDASLDASKQLAKFSHGNFQLARSVLDLISEKRFDWMHALRLIGEKANGDSSQDGEERLHSLYVNLFSSQFATRFEQVRPVLELLIAARRPLHQEEITNALEPMSVRIDAQSGLTDLKPYVTTTPARTTLHHTMPSVFHTPRVSLQHFSFREWLVDETRNIDFLCDKLRGHSILAAYHMRLIQSVGICQWFGQMFQSKRRQDIESVFGKMADSQRAFHVFEAALHLSASCTYDDWSVQVLRQLVGPVALCTPDSRGRTAIHSAAKHGNKPQYLTALRLLLDATCDSAAVAAVQQTKDGKTPLMLAASRGQHLAIRALLDSVKEAVRAGRVDAREAMNAADAALWIAASADAAGVRCVRELLAWGAGGALQGDLDQKLAQVLQRGFILQNAAGKLMIPCPYVDQKGQSALLLATKYENKEAVHGLLASEFWNGERHDYVDIGAGDAVSTSPLYVASSRGNADLVNLLLQHRASPSLLGKVKRERWPRTPLGCACALGHLDCVKALLRSEAGAATLNKCASHRRTPLMESIWHLHDDVVSVLLAHPDIDPKLAGDNGETALHFAAYWGRGRHGSDADHQRATSILEKLLEHFVRHEFCVDLVDNDGCTALCYAAASDGDQHEWVARLLASRANANLRPKGGFRAYGWKSHGSQAVLRNAEPWGGSPLEEAATRSHVRVVAVLLAAFPDVPGSTNAAEIVSFATEPARKFEDSPLHDNLMRTLLFNMPNADALQQVFAQELVDEAPRLAPPAQIPGRSPSVSPHAGPSSPLSPLLCSSRDSSPDAWALPPAELIIV